MINSKFLKIIQTFTHDESKNFQRFIKSPYFNTNKTLIKLLEYISKHIKDSKYLDEMSIYKTLYPGKAFNKKSIRDLSSKMLALCETFISQESFRKETFDVNLHLLKGINPRNLHSIFLTNYGKTLKNAVNSKYDYDYFIRIMSLQKEIFKHHNTYSYENSSKDINAVIANTYKMTTFEILRCSFALETISLSFNKAFNRSYLNDLMKLVKKNSYFNDTLLELYYHLVLLCRGKNEASYKKVINIYDKYKYSFERGIRMEICITLLNYLLIFKNDAESYRNDLYLLMTKMVNEDLYTDENGYVILNFFNNFLDLLINLGKMDEATNFLENNKSKLGFEKLNDDTIHYYRGRIELQLKNYKTALQHFDKVLVKDDILYFNKKMLELICLYELNEVEKLFQKSQLYSRIISRWTNNAAELKREYECFSMHFHLLLQYFDDKTKINLLKQKLEQLSKFKSRNWLLQKTNERLNELK